MGEDRLDLRYWTARRVSRRRLLGGAAIGGASLAAISVVGCSKSSTPTGPATPPGTAVVQNGL